MVSLRRRRLLGLCAGVQSCCLDSFANSIDHESAPEYVARSSNPVSVHPMPMDDRDDVHLIEEVNDPSGRIHSSKDSGCSQSKDEGSQPNVLSSTSSKEQNDVHPADKPVKRRKQHRRRHIHPQEHCDMRGVYFKNMKWQAAIKVNKKQIHLGTVNTQEEAAHLYDRAAYMCRRGTNFELPVEEKQELDELKWDEFLAMTRHPITCRRSRGSGTAAVPPTVQNGDWEGELGTEDLSGSDDVLRLY